MGRRWNPSAVLLVHQSSARQPAGKSAADKEAALFLPERCHEYSRHHQLHDVAGQFRHDPRQKQQQQQRGLEPPADLQRPSRTPTTPSAAIPRSIDGTDGSAQPIAEQTSALLFYGKFEFVFIKLFGSTQFATRPHQLDVYPFKDSTGTATSNENPSSAFRSGPQLHNFNRRPGINDPDYGYKVQFGNNDQQQQQQQYRQPYHLPDPPITRRPNIYEQPGNYYRDEQQPVPIAYRPSLRPTAPPPVREDDSGKPKLVVHLNVYNQKDGGGTGGSGFSTARGDPLVFCC